jgi:hypothetical protein
MVRSAECSPSWTPTGMRSRSTTEPDDEVAS